MNRMEVILKYVLVMWGVAVAIGMMCFIAYAAILVTIMMKEKKKRWKNHESRYTHRKPGD